jgi:hypothetical protein
VITSIDHIVIPLRSDSEREAVARRVAAAGFVLGDSGRSDINRTTNQLFAFTGGAFLELACEEAPRACPLAGLFDVSRIAGVGFTSSDIDQDARWHGAPGAEGEWLWEHDGESSTGVRRSYRANGPVAVGSDHYIFLMEGTEPLYAGVEAAPRLEEIRVGGTESGIWRTRYRDWLNLAADGGDLSVGDVTLRFAETGTDGVEVQLVFSVPTGAGTIELEKGSIHLRESEQSAA